MPQILAAMGDPLRYGVFSREGERPTQEDRCAVVEFQTADGLPALLALVADGVGGRSSGEIASNLASQVICEHVTARVPASGAVSPAMVAALSEANGRIWAMAAENSDYAGMSTTCSAIVIVGRRLYLAHVGDSRVYLVRRGAIHQLSLDHTWAQEALQAGRDPEEIRNHPNRGLIKRRFGVPDDPGVDTRCQAVTGGAANEFWDTASKPFNLEDGDSLFLCSDGVSDVLPDGQIAALVASQPAADNQAATAVVNAALAAGASDNVTAVVVDLPGKVLIAPRQAGRRWLPVYALAALLLVAAAGAGYWSLRPQAPPAPDAREVVVVQATPGSRPTRTAAAPGTVKRPAVSPAAVASPDPAGEALLAPTVTPLPTSTPESGSDAPAMDTALPVPTAGESAAPAKSADAASTAAGSAVAGPVVPPLLVSPADGETSPGSVTFQWQPAGPLPNGAQYEVVVWDENEPPDQARGVHSPVSDTALPVDLKGLYGDVFHKTSFNWTVIVVETEPAYRRLLQPSQGAGARRLVYQPPSLNPPKNGCTGDCAKP